MDMAVVLITDATLMPDAKISIIKQEETDQDDDTVKQILEDLKKDMEDKAAAGSSETPKKKYVNSFITEISVENPPEDFKLNLFMKPTVDIVSNLRPSIFNFWWIAYFPLKPAFK